MNRKTIGILVMTPVLFFALDKGISKDGGGKDGEKKANASTLRQVRQAHWDQSQGSATTIQVATLNNASISNAVVKNEGTTVQQATTYNAWSPEVADEKEKEFRLREIKTTIEYFQNGDGQQEYYDAKTIWFSSPEIPEAEATFLKSVLEKLKETNVESISLKSFSRCPSGYAVMVLSDENDRPTQTGYLVFRSGCSDIPMGLFRYDASSLKMEVKISDTAGYVSLDDYLSLYKKAKS